VKDQRRLGKGLEDVSHLFLSSEERPDTHRSDGEPKEDNGQQNADELFPRVVVVTGDHRSLEKSFLVCNLAVEFARRRRRVRVVDADLSFPDQPFLWGLRPGDSLTRLAAEEDGHDLQIALQGPLGVKLLSLDIDFRQMRGLPQPVRNRIWKGLRAFETDAQLMLINTPALPNENARLIHRLADQTVVLVPSDPLGMIDAYSVIKSILMIKPSASLGIVVYKVRMVAEAESIAQQMTRTLNEFLDINVTNLGYLFADLNIERSMMRRTPLCLMPSHSKATQCLSQIAERIWLHRSTQDQKTDLSFFEALGQELEKPW
jgi:flagellar biosynthesis protein FlhG